MSPKHLLSVRDLSPTRIKELVEQSVIEGIPHCESLPQAPAVAMIFMEPSTRTRTSFELAAKALGRRTVVLGSKESSLSKDETLWDTMLNLHAMGCEVFILRSSAEVDIEALRSFSVGPLINAGAGVSEHPTQALLDLATIWNKTAGRSWEAMKRQRWVMVGDLKRSRVAGSWSAMAEMLGLDLHFVSPPEWAPETLAPGQTWTDNLEKGLQGATGLISLRVQKERFAEGETWNPRELEAYVKNYQITAKHLKKGEGLWMMHPGPVNWGVELEAGLLNYEKSLILEQVAHGMKIRSRLLYDLLR
jgi:aspartate carbamoyltransferase catalytic subunit